MPHRNCLIITENIAGTENQCIAVAEALATAYEISHVYLKPPFSLLTPHLIKKVPKWAIEGIDWNAPEPDIVIAAGRKAVPATLHFKNSFKVFLQDPKVNPKNFDLVAAPLHDNLRGDNVLSTYAAPNRVTEEHLKKAKNDFDFSHLPKTKIAVLIGGNSKSHTMDSSFSYALFEQLMPYLQSDEYGIMMTVSRRTPPQIYNHLKDLFSTPNCDFWDGKGENPYFGYLAWADYILVTEDSTSMISDALSTGTPAYRLPMRGGSEKFSHLYQNLKRRCMFKEFDGELKPYDYKPLRDAQKIADEIKKRIAQ